MKESISPQSNYETPSFNFKGSIPETYDRVLGKFLFEPFAKDLATRLSNETPTSILELASGTGRVTRHLVNNFPKAERIIASDISMDMMQVAQKSIQGSNIEWRQIDINSIPFSDDTFDIIVCQFGLMFLQDKQKGFVEILRVLKPGGKFFFNVWGPLDKNPIWKVSNKIITQFLGPMSMAMQNTGPFSMSDKVLVTDQLIKAGFKTIDVDPVTVVTQRESASVAAAGFIHGLPVKEIIEKVNPSILGEMQYALETKFESCFGIKPMNSSLNAWLFETTK